MIRPHVQPGVTTGELDDICHEYITGTQQAIPAPLDYRGFPKSICTSVNHVICHGIPGDKRLKDGDIVNIDITVIKDGWHGDTSKMFLVGKSTIKGKRICNIAHRSMVTGIEMVRPVSGSAISGTRSRDMPKARAVPWCGSTVDMVSGRVFMKTRRFCIMAGREPGKSWCPEWCSPLSP